MLAVSGLSVTYDTRGERRRVLEQVTFQVGQGDAVGIVGESGCGKSTLGLAIMRALPKNGHVDAGSVVVGGTELYSLPTNLLRAWRGRALGMVTQDPTSALTPSLTIGQQVAEVYRYVNGQSKREAMSSAGDVLAAVGLAPPRSYLGRYPHELSGGQRQRVAIGMAVAAKPSLLVLDEPTTGLDATVEAEVIDLVNSLRGEFVNGLIFITHNLGLVSRSCNRLEVVYAGRVVEEGPTGELLGGPAHPYTAALLACLPRPGARAQAVRLPYVPGSPPVPGEVLAGCKFAPRCPLRGEECTANEPLLVTFGTGRNVRCVHPGRAGTALAPPSSRQKGGRGDVLLELRGITKRFRSVLACDAVDLIVRSGETVGLVGESGSGKTTVARIVAGLTTADSGSLYWRGELLAPDIAKRPRAVVRALQLVLQHPDTTLNPRHRARSILARTRRRLAGPRRVEELAASVRLEPHHLDSLPGELSGGLKQRVAIARAFAGQPELVVCDEPVSSLDVSVQAAILNLLADLQSSDQTAFLFISHDLAVVRFLSHRVVVMYLGQVVEVGETDDIFAGPRHPYTDALISAMPSMEPGQARAVLGERAVTAVPEQGCVFQARCPHKLGTVCEQDPPPMRAGDNGHTVRCHLSLEQLAEAQRLYQPVSGRGCTVPSTSMSTRSL